MTAISDLLREIDLLAPMPDVVRQIMNKAEDPQCSMSEIADIIIFDPILTANVLKIVNSAYYSLPRKIDSVQDAITVLGMNQVIDIVVLKSGAKTFSNDQRGYGLYEGDLWKCAVSCALIARGLAVKLKAKNSRMIFTAALIKDIGKVILDRLVEGSIDKIHKLVNEKGFSFREAEKKVIGVDHAEIGAYIADKWGFSSQMVKIIRNHHLNDLMQDNLETSIVYLADNVCMMMGIGVGEDGLAYRFHEDVLIKLGVSPDDLQVIIAGFGDEMKKIEDLLSST
ncbi:MAG: HDOD domain-containing protein [Proteobacteria bacterium]|nr:HDOD domain-containing protein [Pseudomonadota bacterium]